MATLPDPMVVINAPGVGDSGAEAPGGKAGTPLAEWMAERPDNAAYFAALPRGEQDALITQLTRRAVLDRSAVGRDTAAIAALAGELARRMAAYRDAYDGTEAAGLLRAAGLFPTGKGGGNDSEESHGPDHFEDAYQGVAGFVYVVQTFASLFGSEYTAPGTAAAPAAPTPPPSADGGRQLFERDYEINSHHLERLLGPQMGAEVGAVLQRAVELDTLLLRIEESHSGCECQGCRHVAPELWEAVAGAAWSLRMLEGAINGAC